MNVVKAIGTRQLHTVFIEWMKDAVESISGVVAVDGKQARRTKDAKKRALHVVSAFSTECGLVLGQLACEEKSNEITAIPYRDCKTKSMYTGLWSLQRKPVSHTRARRTSTLSETMKPSTVTR